MHLSESLVSVIIPSFKMGRFIGEALASVGAQTYPHWEVIVVDDAGPEDGTRAAVEAFAAKHPDHRVEYIRHETNQGVSVARRTAFEASRGEYVAFLDADDAYVPDRLASALEVFSSNPDCILVHSRASGVGTTAAFTGGPEDWYRMGEHSRLYDPRAESSLMKMNHICNSTVVAARSEIKSEDFACKMLYQFEDWLLWLLLARRGKFFYQHECLTRYRLHPGSFMGSPQWQRGVRDFGKIELMLALFPSLERAEDQQVAAGMILEKLQSLLGSRTVRGSAVASRWGLKLRWALLKEIVSADLGRVMHLLAPGRRGSAQKVAAKKP